MAKAARETPKVTLLTSKRRPVHNPRGDKGTHKRCSRVTGQTSLNRSPHHLDGVSHKTEKNAVEFTLFKESGGYISLETNM